MNLRRLFLISAPAILLLVLWELTTANNQRLLFLFASPSTVLQAGFEDFAARKLMFDLSLTAAEAICGLFVGATLGTSVGLILWLDKRLADIARPYIVVVGAIPIFAIAPMLIIWFGTGFLSKVVMSAFAVFFVSLAQAYDGARFCAAEFTGYARSIAAPRRFLLRKVIIPGALRWVTAGLKVSVGLSLLGAFIGEFVSSQAGLGHYILSAGSLYDMPRVLFGVILVSILALLFTSVIWGIERWKPHIFSK